MLFAVGVHRLMFPLMHAISRTETVKDKDIDWILENRIPAEGIPEEGVVGGSILASRVPIKMQDEDCGFD